MTDSLRVNLMPFQNLHLLLMNPFVRLTPFQTNFHLKIAFGYILEGATPCMLFMSIKRWWKKVF